MSKYVMGLMSKDDKHKEPKTLEQVRILVDNTDASIMFTVTSEKEKNDKMCELMTVAQNGIFIVKFN